MLSKLFKFLETRHVLVSLGAVFFLSVLALTLAYQARPTIVVEFAGNETVWLRGFFEPVIETQRAFRWTDGAATLAIPNLGETVPLRLRMRVNGWAPEGAREIRVFVNGYALPVQASGDWKTIEYVIHQRALLEPERLVLRIESDTFSPRAVDPNSPVHEDLGIAVDRVRVDFPFDTAQFFTVPPFLALFLFGCFTTALFAFLIWLDAPRVIAWSAALLVILVASAATALERINLSLLVGAVMTSALVGLAVVALLARRAQFKLAAAHVKYLSAVILVLALLLVGGGLRLRAMVEQPLDYDEQVYIPAAREYAELLGARDVNGFLQYEGNFEHPAFAKVTYAFALLGNRALGEPLDERTAARFFSTLAGIGLVVLMGFLNPLSGLALAVHGIEIRYVSEAYLEAMPALFSTVAIVSYARYRSVHARRWFVLAAIALGVTAASKYVYLIAGLAIAPFLVWDHRRQLWLVGAFGLIAAGVFFLLNPLLWVDPLGRMTSAIQFHLNYQDDKGARSGREWWFLIAYLFQGSEPTYGFRVSFDTVTFVLGWLGVPLLARKNKMYLLWFVLAFLFLLVWRTKWNQYALVFLAPMCLSAGLAAQAGLEWVKEKWRGRVTLAQRQVTP